MAGALVVPALGVGWVGNGDLFLSFRCRPGGHQAKGAGVGLVAWSLEELPFTFRYFSFIFIDFWLSEYIYCK